jgi:sacsin
VALVSPEHFAGPRAGLYDAAFPRLAAAAAAGDEVAGYCLRQCLAASGRLPVWRLRTGRLVHLAEGCFLQPSAPADAQGSARQSQGGAAAPAADVAARRSLEHGRAASSSQPLPGLGSAAIGYMARHLPLLDVPWALKAELEAADVHGLRVVSPAVVRPLLRQLGSRGGSVVGGAGGGTGAGGRGGGGGGAARPSW